MAHTESEQLQPKSKIYALTLQVLQGCHEVCNGTVHVWLQLHQRAGCIGIVHEPTVIAVNDDVSLSK